MYVDDAPPEAMASLILQVRGILADSGLSQKPLWDTEAGWLRPAEVPAGLAPAYLARAEILNWAAGAERFYWFAWEGRPLGVELVTSDNATLTPAGHALETVEHWLLGATLQDCSANPDGVWQCTLLKSGSTSHILWSTHGTQAFPLPTNWKAHNLQSLAGINSPINDNHLDVGPEPIWVNESNTRWSGIP